MPHRTGIRLVALATACVLSIGTAAFAFAPPDRGFAPGAAVEQVHRQAFFVPDLAIGNDNYYLPEVLGYLPNAGEWDRFFVRYGTDFHIYVDPRSGVATNVMGAIPMLPGTGTKNTVTLEDLAAKLGRPVTAVTPAVVRDVFLQWLRENQGAIGIDVRQLGEPRVTPVANYLWQIFIPQRVGDIPVRHGLLIGTINHGNLVLMGTQTWENVAISMAPAIDANDALNLGFTRVGGWYGQDVLWKVPELEVIPYQTRETSVKQQIGGGYGHRLAWVFGFQRLPDYANWEIAVDAHTGEVLAIEDKNHYATERIVGGIYPLTDTEVCPTQETCGTMQPNYPMPFTNTGLAAPNNYTNTDGTFDYTSGTVTTTLNGRYVRMLDNCGAISASASGSINLGGTNAQHNCTTPGSGGAGNTPASRSGMYELNKLIEMARGWLPANAWLNAQLTANMNINLTCNAFWNGASVNFYRSGGGCRNTGEIAAVFDHEWGHGIDDNDANGIISRSGEGYADIASILRLEASCVGHGFYDTSGTASCGLTVDGTGRNVDEDQTGALHCATDCSGVRDSDWAKHADNTPDTPTNHVCPRCLSSTNVCARQTHCAGAPQRQAGWDFAARDLQVAPFNYSRNLAFIIANKTFYLGSGNINNWYTCTCPTTHNGCNADSGYLQWLAADDDNGNLNDGTPHMTALFAAFNRHGIACATPTPINGGCAGGPTAAPTLSVTAGANQAVLTWNAISGATRYWVFRGEGYAGCNFGKAKIATVTALTYTDTEVANGTAYCYTVIPAAASDACFGLASNCVCVTPGSSCPTITVNPATLPNGTVGTAYSQTITATGGTAPYTFAVTAGALPGGLSLNGTTGVLSGTPTASGPFNFTITATGVGPCTGLRAYSITIACPTITVSPTTLPNGTVGTAYSQTITASGGTAPYTFAVTAGALPGGLTLNGTSGVLSGTPSAAGPFSFTITATGGGPCTGSRAYNVTMGCPAITVAPATLPNGTVGTAYSQTITASGGTGPYTFAVTAGALPSGLTLNGSSGLLSGTPSAAGSFNFTITATGFGGCTGSQAYANVTMTCPAITLAPAALAAGTVGSAYSDTVTASGGTAPYTYAVTTGTLPAGLALNASTGEISGTPTTAGTSNVDITATDAFGCTGTASYAITVTCPAITLTPATLPAATIGAAYSQTVVASGGTAPYTYGLTAGTLPAGLALNASTGEISGTPTTVGTSNFTVTATDAFGCTGDQAYTLDVNCSSITITPAALADGTEGIAYSVTFAATGGTAPYTWSVGGTLPAGLGLSATTGVMSGTPTLAGAYTFDIVVTDAQGCTAFTGTGKIATKRYSARATYAMTVNAAFDYVVGEGLGQPNGNLVRIYTRGGTASSVTFPAYASGQFGTNVSAADVNGGSYGEVLTGPGPGPVYGPHVRAWDRAGTALAKVSFFAYSTLKYGVNVGGGELDGDAFAEILTGAGPGEVFGPHVRGFNYDNVSVTALAKVSFFAYGTLKYGANVEEGDVDGDAFAEVLTGPGPGAMFGPQVRGFNYDNVTLASMAKINFMAFAVPQYGCWPSGGDVEADGFAEIAATPGAGPALTAQFKGFNYDNASIGNLAGFDITPYGTLYGARVGLGDLAADGGWDLLCGAGPDPAATSRTFGFDYTGAALVPLPGSGFVPFTSMYGVTVAGGTCGYI